MPNTDRITLGHLARHYGPTFDTNLATATRTIQLGRLVSPTPDDLDGQLAEVELKLWWSPTAVAKSNPDLLYYGRPQFSVAGTITPATVDGKASLTSWGQNRELMLDRVQDPRWPMIERLWRLYHHNGLHEECSHMRELDWWPADNQSFPIVTTVKGEELPIHQVTKTQHPKGLLGRRCKLCGHHYGSERLYEMIPADDLELIHDLIITATHSMCQFAATAA